MGKNRALMFFLISLLSVTLCADTNYTDPTDPVTWGGSCQNVGFQSPIDIITANTVSCGLEKIKLTFFDGNELLDSTGQAAKAPFPGSNLAIVTEDNKFFTYSSIQYHFHQPAEHEINGVRGDAEIHIVHRLDEYYDIPQTLAVTGFIFRIDATATTDLFDTINFFN